MTSRSRTCERGPDHIVSYLIVLLKILIASIEEYHSNWKVCILELLSCIFLWPSTAIDSTSLPMSRHAPLPKSPPPPPPLPPGYHKRQRCGPSGVDPSPSRPLSPMEQFDMTVEYHVWEKEASGEPAKEDLEVRTCSLEPWSVFWCHCFRWGFVVSYFINILLFFVLSVTITTSLKR